MNIREKLGIDSYDRDKVTGVEMTHEQKYGKIVEIMGEKAVRNCIPFNSDEIKAALEGGDHYLNTLPIKQWDWATGLLRGLYHKAGINTWSLADGVCILKEAARRMAKEEVAK